MGLETYKDPPKAGSLNFPKYYLVETRNLYPTWLAEDHRIEIEICFCFFQIFPPTLKSQIILPKYLKNYIPFSHLWITAYSLTKYFWAKNSWKIEIFNTP